MVSEEQLGHKPRHWLEGQQTYRFLAYDDGERVSHGRHVQRLAGIYTELVRTEPALCNHTDNICEECIADWRAVGVITSADHGSRAMYQMGCKCARCKVAHARWQQEWQESR
jgi:hypothetical protein